MDFNTIKALIEKYFAGETSLAEEEQIRNYFLQDEVADELRQYQPLFTFFQAEKKQTTSPAFDAQLQQRTQRGRQARLRLMRRLSAAAAVIVMLLAAWLLYPETAGPTDGQMIAKAPIDWSKYEPKTEEEALEVTRGALLRTSAAMYKGLTQAAVEVESVKKIMEWE